MIRQMLWGVPAVVIAGGVLSLSTAANAGTIERAGLMNPVGLESGNPASGETEPFQLASHGWGGHHGHGGYGHGHGHYSPAYGHGHSHWDYGHGGHYLPVYGHGHSHWDYGHGYYSPVYGHGHDHYVPVYGYGHSHYGHF